MFVAKRVQSKTVAAIESFSLALFTATQRTNRHEDKIVRIQVLRRTVRFSRCISALLRVALGVR